jgi:hypothetical protein
MTYSEDQVEWIVVEVLRRLGVAQAKQYSAPRGSELHVNERVVSMRLIEGRLNGVTRLIVPPRAVVTPAVKDHLKQRKIELVREDRT